MSVGCHENGYPSFKADKHAHLFGEEAVSILAGLTSKERCQLPNVYFLYDKKGSELFEEITRQPEYYLTSTEMDILSMHARDICRYPGEDISAPREFTSSYIELGAGVGKKMSPILEWEKSLVRTSSAFTKYIPVDYSASALEENVTIYNKTDSKSKDFLKIIPHVGTNEEVLPIMSDLAGKKTFIFLGSSLGNDEDPVPFLKRLISNCGPTDRVIIGVDLAADEHIGGRKSVAFIEDAYNDSAGVTSDFILNSLAVINRQAGLDFDLNNFKHVAEYNSKKEAVEIFVECVAPCEVTATSTARTKDTFHIRYFEPGDRIFIEQSGKFSRSCIKRITSEAGMAVTRTWGDKHGNFCLFEAVPHVAKDITDLSKFIFEDLVGAGCLSDQPIDLRNPWAFYYGHISAFSDRVALMLPGRDDDRNRYERGVDPDVDDPTKIHSHSERLQEWPEASDFHEYAKVVEAGLEEVLSSSGPSESYLMAIEHADMHHETLMYNMTGCETLSRQSIERRNRKDYSNKHPFSAFKKAPLGGVHHHSQKSYADIPLTSVSLGCSDQSLQALGFVWDNELPSQPAVDVHPFKVSVTPVTNKEFSHFVEDGGYANPAYWASNHVSDIVVRNGGMDAWSWILREELSAPRLWDQDLSSGGWGVRTACDGVVPVSEAASEWPAWVTLFEAAAFCEWLGGGARLMSEYEYHALFNDDEALFNAASRKGNNNWKYRSAVPVGILEDGVAASGVTDLVGNGWEWTSTEFAPLHGFVEMPTYPEYSADFFDGKHFVLKGASPYTSRRLQRMSFRNFFQANYPFVHAKFRVVYD